jgi:hypothetical protein
MANRYIKCAKNTQMQIKITQMQIKITMKYYLTTVRMVIFKSEKIRSVGKDVDKGGPLHTVVGM